MRTRTSERFPVVVFTREDLLFLREGSDDESVHAEKVRKLKRADLKVIADTLRDILCEDSYYQSLGVAWDSFQRNQKSRNEPKVK